jgi:aquaporin Z
MRRPDKPVDATVSDTRRMLMDRRFWAEALGTAVLVMGGVGSAVLAGRVIGALGIALAFGLSLLVMAYAIGPISGCHINPAVTAAMLTAKRIDLRTAAGYWIAQIVGGIVGAGIVLLLAKGSPGGYVASVGGLGANGYGIHSPFGFNLGAALLAEVVLTGLLAFTVVATTAPTANTGFAGLAIGLVLTLIHLVDIPITNASVNPARSIGPAVFVGGWALGQLWLFVIAPMVGGTLGALAYQGLQQLPRELPVAPELPKQAVSRFEEEQQRRRAG